MADSQRKSKLRLPQVNSIHAAIQAWLCSIPAQSHENDPSWRDDLLNGAPKRFTIYEPMALLPAGSFTSLPWTTALEMANQDDRSQLWSLILRELSKQAKGELTHLAINEGIPLHKDGAEDENIPRSPSRLRMLHGDFGPAETSSRGTSKEELEQALWVSTKQNGIYQTWAPRWTMFSRGNVKEKARLLDFGKTQPKSASTEDVWAVDLYAGIGYFVFSYATLGMRVLCWEINPWSVEGLRRGAATNCWSVKVVQGEELNLSTENLLAGGEQIVVFLESNEQALQRVKDLQAAGRARNIQHINCGFLPTSEPTWRPAWNMAAHASEAWLHLHENVGVNDTETRRKSIQGMFDEWTGGTDRRPRVEHIELVKTFAPGVWHCVFDVHITTSSIIT